MPPFQGSGFSFLRTQGCALGYRIAPFQGTHILGTTIFR